MQTINGLLFKKYLFCVFRLVERIILTAVAWLLKSEHDSV